MTAQEQRQELCCIVTQEIKSLKVSSKVWPYVSQFIKDCNLHQLQNLHGNMSEFKKFIKQSLTTSWAK